MDVRELISVLRGELEQARPGLDAAVQTVFGASDGEASLAEAAQSYAIQFERMAAAAEVVGLNGLATVCARVKCAAEELGTVGREARMASKQYFTEWPGLVLRYLEAPEDYARAEGLVARLAAPPIALPAAECVALMQTLAAPPQLPAELLADTSAERQRIASAEDVILEVPADVDPNVYGAFIDDAPAQVARLGELTDLLAQGNAKAGELAEAKRIFHTFKGTANIIGIRGIATIAHHAEDLLEFLENRATPVPEALSQTLVDAAACLDQMVYALLGREEPPSAAVDILQRLLDWANRIDAGQIDEYAPAPAPAGGPAAGETENAPPTPAAPPEARAEAARAGALSAEASFRVPVATVDEMMRLIGDLATRLGEGQENLSILGEHARELLARHHHVQRRLEEIEDMIDLRGLALQRQAARADVGDFDPLELDRYNELHGSAHALMEEAIDAREIALQINADLQRISNALHGQQYAYRDLQHLVLGTRLAPVATLIARLNRNVRQTCQATRKQAELIVDGADVAIDAEVLNQLADPLLHVLRNAVDHGIESPEAREAAGKPRTGRIGLRFARQGEGIAVRCADDGRGLDFEAIRRKAESRGLIGAGQTLSERELAHLVLLPGFSTRDAVTEISGRGVGLDVVSERVRAMKGTVTISSTPGSGTVVEMRVQASLSLVHALLVDLGGVPYAVPAQHAEFVLAAGEATPAGYDNGEPLVEARGETMRARRLADFISGATEPLTPQAAAALPAIVVRAGEHLAAVIVDKVYDARNLVLKSTSHYLSLLRGLAGVSVAQSGRALPLLDLPMLLADPALARMASVARQTLDALAIERKSVLVADDSLSVRRMLRELVEDAGFVALTARDGAEAWDLLREARPDLVLTDLEMPNMNGLQLTSAIRGSHEFAALPVIMISSRSMEKHRRQAAEAGVNLYVTKPYSEVELVEHIRRLLGAESKASPE